MKKSKKEKENDKDGHWFYDPETCFRKRLDMYLSYNNEEDLTFKDMPMVAMQWSAYGFFFNGVFLCVASVFNMFELILPGLACIGSSFIVELLSKLYWKRVIKRTVRAYPSLRGFDLLVGICACITSFLALSFSIWNIILPI